MFGCINLYPNRFLQSNNCTQHLAVGATSKKKKKNELNKNLNLSKLSDFEDKKKQKCLNNKLLTLSGIDPFAQENQPQLPRFTQASSLISRTSGKCTEQPQMLKDLGFFKNSATYTS
ncbi:hypothetical protein AYI69_g9514 [Smittium culicis]|uniref:Uncharacterized protein n=1 Tax=Smittium culicis TaxID=133412 RepID=A0A1R1XC63_9FUNG|nr:hypothetical protein AYI69_g9514 [Smittium culicis]